MREIETNPPASVRPAESLSELAWLINAKHEDGEQAARMGLAHFREAGRALLRAKEILPHGQFQNWVRENLKCSLRSARAYQRVAAHWGKVAAAATLSDALEMLLDDSDDRDEPEAGKPERDPALCDRCNRVGAVKGCPACGDLAAARQKGKKRRRKAKKKLRQLEIGFDPTEEHRRTLREAAEYATLLAEATATLLGGPFAGHLRSLADAHQLPLVTVEEERQANLNAPVEMVSVEKWPAVETLPAIFAELTERSEAGDDAG